MQTVKTQKFNYKSVDIKIQFFSHHGARRSRLAVLLRCWTWTEALVVTSSWINEWLRAQAVESESTRDRYLSLTYLYSSLGLVSSGVFQKSAAGGSFARKTALKATRFGREVGSPIFGRTRVSRANTALGFASVLYWPSRHAPRAVHSHLCFN